jgi:hypothetical protein
MAARLPEIGISEMAGGKILYIPYIEANEGRVCKVTVEDHTKDSRLLKKNREPYTLPGSDVPYRLSEFVRTPAYNFFQPDLKIRYEICERTATKPDQIAQRHADREELRTWIQEVTEYQVPLGKQFHGATKLDLGGKRRKSKRRKSRRRKTRR